MRTNYHSSRIAILRAQPAASFEAVRPPQSQHNLFTVAIRTAIVSLSLGIAVAPTAMAEASAQSANTARSYQINAGALSDVLAQFAANAGVQLVFDPATLAGQTSNGLQGSYTVQQGFAQLLQGTNWEVQAQGANAYALKQNVQTLAEVTVSARRGTAGELPEVVVMAEPLRDGVTENTGSYTTNATSTATKMNLSIRETPQSISVVTRQRMDDQELTSITKVLEQTPGITISRDVGERFNIISRGNGITKFQYDGLSTHVESQTQNMSQNLADMSIYDKVEIVRGATGLMTGAGYPSGMVNMVRKRPTKEFQASLTGSVGRWDDYRGQVDISGPLIEGGRLRARLVGAKQDNNSFTDYYSQKRDVLYGVVEADVTNSTTVRFGADFNRYETRGGTGVPAMYTDGGQTNFSRSTTATSKYKNPVSETTNYFFNIDQALPNDWKLVVGGNYMDVGRKGNGYTVFEDFTGAAIDRETGRFDLAKIGRVNNPIDQKAVSINLQGPFSLFGREHQAIFGYEFSRYKSNWSSYDIPIYTTGILSDIQEPPASLVRRSVPNTQNFYNLQSGFYGVLRLNPTDKLHVSLGARVSDYKYSVTWNNSLSGYKKSGEVTPYAGLVYDITPEQSLYVSYTDIFMPNTVVDINGKVIDPKIGSNYEAGWKGEFYDGRLNANVAIYQPKTDNNTELAGYHDANTPYYRAVDGVKTKGIDIEIAGEVLPGWDVSASYSHSKSEEANGTRRNTEHPLNTVKLWNTYRFSGDWRGLIIGGGARWISKTHADYKSLSSKVVQDAYTVVDLVAGYKFNKNLSATLNISNLLDKKYYTGLGNLGWAYYGEPRNVRVGMRYDF